MLDLWGECESTLAYEKSKGNHKKRQDDLSDISFDMVSSPGYGMSGKGSDPNATQAMIDEYASDELDGW